MPDRVSLRRKRDKRKQALMELAATHNMSASRKLRSAMGGVHLKNAKVILVMLGWNSPLLISRQVTFARMLHSKSLSA